ncbi:MAG: helix-turn-helix domain-containing protein [Parasporobacterium sp.]|nr:helix-turn-helix domain-containing protein [Parasporobacterium sp.]
MSEKNSLKQFKCEIFHGKNETEHFHRDIELIFIIDGHIHVMIENNEFRVETEEFLLINSNRKHFIYVDEESMVCRFYISYDMISQLFEEDYIAFWCNIISKKDPGYEELKNTTRELIRLKVQDIPAERFRMMEQYAKLINLLTHNYRICRTTGSDLPEASQDSQLQEIISFINNNYNEPLNLADLADRMFVSLSTMSRLFKKTTGAKFPDYINQIRLHHAIDDLLNTNKSVTEIAVDNGFSTPSSFNRVFKEIYGTTPSQYKKSVRSNVDREEEGLTTEEESHVKEYLKEKAALGPQVRETPLIDLKPGSGKQFHPIATQTVSLGAFYQLTNSSVQSQIRQMAEQLGLSYIRMWNIFSPRCMVAVSPQEKTLSFEQIDIALDFLVSIHLHPFLDMTDHPECLIKNGRKLFFRKEDSMGFQSLEQWSYFLDKLMEHVVFRYGYEEVSRWIFEFGDYSVESGLDYYGTGEAYYSGNIYKDVFQASYKIIKSHCRDAMVGGPDWVFDGKKISLQSHFDVWKSIGIWPDFYSIHIFPYMNNTDETTGYSHDRSMDPDFLNKQIHQANRMLEECHAPKRPLYVTETTTILSNRNSMNDHLNRGTNVLRVANLFQGYADMVCFWVATDRLSLHYAPAGILHGGSGLMSKDGIPKPTYFALYFLSKLGTDLIGQGPGYLAVQNSPNNIYILCYNHKNLKYDYKYEEENTVNVYNVNTMFQDQDFLQIRFMVHGLEAGQEYVIKRHVVNQESGSVIDEWKRLGYEPEMRSNDIQYMKNICVPRIRMEHRVAEKGMIYLEAQMQPHEMLLLHIYK